MEIPPTIEAVNALLRQGDTGSALETLRIFLEENNRRYPDALRLLRVLEANYASARQQELKGILPYQEVQREYNRINDALSAVLADLEAGRTPGASVGRTRRQRTWLILGAALVVLVAAVLLIFRHDDVECPDFGPTPGVCVMLLPFQHVSGQTGKPEFILQDGIRNLTKKNNLTSSVQVLTKYDSETKNPDHNAAAALGKHCEADLVVWGRYAISDSTRVNVNYVFTENLQTGSSGYQAFKDLTELQSGVMPTRTLDDALLSLCAMMAIHAGDMPLAKKWLDKVKEPTAQDSAMLRRLGQ